MTAKDFEWTDVPCGGNPIGDSPHFEYHPYWEGFRGISGEF
jgi:hypothetical protein